MAKILDQKIPKGVSINVTGGDKRNDPRRTIHLDANIEITDKSTTKLFDLYRNLTAQQGRMSTDFHRDILDAVTGRKLGTLRLTLTDWDTNILQFHKVNGALQRIATEDTHGITYRESSTPLCKQFMNFTALDIM